MRLLPVKVRKNKYYRDIRIYYPLSIVFIFIHYSKIAIGYLTNSLAYFGDGEGKAPKTWPETWHMGYYYRKYKSFDHMLEHQDKTYGYQLHRWKTNKKFQEWMGTIGYKYDKSEVEKD